VAVLTRSTGSSSSELRLQALQEAALALQLQLQVFSIPNVDGLEQAVSAMDPAGAQALLILPSPVWDPIWKQIADLAAQHRLPAITEYSEFPRAGGLLAYGVDRLDIHRHAATYVDRILKGARPGDLPMERPTRFEFIINLKTAQALGLTIPPSVLQQVTELIQ
jgi:putative tryptophan/tyrosine transport system substrate-binding protein